MNEMNLERLHPSEGELIRFIDQELSDLEAGRVRRHLRACARCGDRTAELRTRASSASAALGALGESIPVDPVARARALAAVQRAARQPTAPRHSTGWARRAAAALAILVAGSLAVSPLRAWVLDRWTSETTAPAAPTRLPTLSPAVVAHVGPRILFEPASGAFEIAVQHAQVDGELKLETRDVARASAQVTNGGSESVLVLPSGLRIENGASSAASYSVVLPAGLQSVRVTVGGKTVVSRMQDGGATWSATIPLQAAGHRR